MICLFMFILKMMGVYDVDAFYKKITKVTHNFSKDVVALSRVDFVTMGEIYLLLSVEDPR